VVTSVGTALAGVVAPVDLLDAVTRPADPHDPAEDRPGAAAMVVNRAAARRELFDPDQRLRRRGLRYKDRATRLALCAATEALDLAGLVRDGTPAVPGETVGVVVSGNLANLDTVCAVVTTIATGSVADTSPMDLPNASSNEVAASVAIWFGLRGVNLTVCNGDTSGIDAIGWADRLIHAGRSARVLVIGVEVASEPARALVGHPGLFDGAVAVVLEAADAADQRGVPALATIGGAVRRADLDACLHQLQCADTPIGLRLVPDAAAPAEAGGADVGDLTDLGYASGALGVLQCATATAWLAAGGRGAVLAVAGGTGCDATAALLVGGAP
jgi:3-oxoacyl-[acyl-carrier-protein] synthase II